MQTKIDKNEKNDLTNRMLTHRPSKKDLLGHSINNLELLIREYEEKHPEDKRLRLAMKNAKDYLADL